MLAVAVSLSPVTFSQSGLLSARPAGLPEVAHQNWAVPSVPRVCSAGLVTVAVVTEPPQDCRMVGKKWHQVPKPCARDRFQ